MECLFGAKVAGIQRYIFETEKLKEIAGASDLIDFICKDFFISQLQSKCNIDFSQDGHRLIQGAAGHIKYVFSSVEECQCLVKSLDYELSRIAYGLKFAWSYLPVESYKKLTAADFRVLEKDLAVKEQLVFAESGVPWMAVQKSRQTGKSSFLHGNKKIGDANFIDRSQYCKLKHFHDLDSNGKNPAHQLSSPVSTLIGKLLGSDWEKYKVPKQLSQIDANFRPGKTPNDDRKNWIAVVHADGNAIGKLVARIGNSSSGSAGSNLREFSERLNDATIQATRRACQDLIAELKLEPGDYVPIRPVVIGGDDLTVIISAPLALTFTQNYLRYFEEESKAKFSVQDVKSLGIPNGMTACAGIAAIKSNYPMHYAVDLAEGLCKFAKNKSKKISGVSPPSSLQMFKVNSSHIGDFENVVVPRELEFLKTIEVTDDVEAENRNVVQQKVSFLNGPYFLHETQGYNTINDLTKWVKILQRKDSPKGLLRDLLGRIVLDQNEAERRLKRIRSLHGPKLNALGIHELFNKIGKEGSGDGGGRKDQMQLAVTHIYDMLSFSTFK